MTDNLGEIIKRCAIKNRLQYGKAEEKSVLGKVLSQVPEAKKNIKNVSDEIKEIVAEVNKLDISDLKSDDVVVDKIDKRDRIPGLKLPDKPRGVVMRFAPNPNGPATLGSARGIVINSVLAKKYGGKFIIRFDDTDPKNKKPMLEAYEWYIEDCVWLDAKPDEIHYASDRILEYYELAERLISLGKAYVCFCSMNEFKKLKDSMKACPHRDMSIEKNQERWKEMLEGRYREGEAVLRIKTDMKHRDPAIRDWVGFRIVEEEHPRVGRKFRVWPMLDFESAIEDHLLGITHIIRGKDLMDSGRRQKFIYDYLNWRYPKTLHWGRIRLEEFGKFSTSGLKKAIQAGVYTGWDDPGLPTLMALRRRGITPEAVKKVMVSLGMGENDISLSMEHIYAENRKILDPVANRYFFVQDPVKLVVKGASETKVRIPLHIGFPKRGFKEFDLRPGDKGDMELFISGKDAGNLIKGEVFRLMNLFNVRVKEVDSRGVVAEYLREKRLDVKKIQWVWDYLEAEVVKPGGIIKGFCERNCMDLKPGDEVQFERFGFVKLDEKNRKLIFYLSHR
ncbi:MAG: glutamate--tRNA ligase [Candidatus Altiarchaeota archaeon]|nr:glutamate--tRNA ligase [Candidatus Altiarchaeota archaeon]